MNESNTPSMTGKVSRLFIGKGYGFIAGDDKKDYFFHMSGVNPEAIAFRHIEIGSAVKFDIYPPLSPGKNLQAKNIYVNASILPMVQTEAASV